MAKADGLKHGRPAEALAVMCHCECNKFQYCPITDEDPPKWRECKEQYKAMLKEKQNG